MSSLSSFAFVKHEHQTYKTFICFNRRKVRKKAIHMNKRGYFTFFPLRLGPIGL